MKFIIGAMTSLLLVAVMQMTASAAGIGGHFDFDFSGGTTDMKHQGSYGTDTNGDITNISAGGGLVFDSNLMGPGLFNYRLKLGGDYFINEGESEFEGAGGHLLNYFGFKIFRSPRVRLWIGPMLGVRYITGDFSGTHFSTEDSGIIDAYSGYFSSMFFGNIGFHQSTATYNLLGVETGLTFGMNFALSELVILSAEVSGKYLFFYGRRDRKIVTLFSLTAFSPDYQKNRDTIIAHNGAIDISLSIMFRFGEGRLGRKR